MATAFRYDGTVINPVGQALSGVLVYVCTQPATTNVIPPSPLATLFADPNSAIPLANPVVVDGNGNFFFYAPTGVYTLVYFSPFTGETIGIFPDQEVVTPGGGSVTSVALTAPVEFTITGSPVTGSGTLAISKANQNVNKVYAGPSSGPAAAPTFRSLVAADFPAGVGTVTSVALSITGSALLALGISGSPITSAGTLAVTVNFVNQAANVVLAGPASGGSGAVVARSLVAADMVAATTVAFSATPTFDASIAAFPTFKMTLTGNVTSSSMANLTPGQVVTFVLTQDGTGGRTFVWPAIVKGASFVSPDPGSVTSQSFVYDGAALRATGPGLVTAS